MSQASNSIPAVVAVIVTWNKRVEVLRLLANLAQLEYPADRLQIVLVDNASADGTVEAVAREFPAVKCVENRENLGGAGGFNRGLRWVLCHRPDSSYIWLLDNDVLVARDSLSELVRVLETRPAAGICGSEIVDIADRSTSIEAGAFIDYAIGEVRSNRPTEPAQGDRRVVFRVDYVAACSLLVRTSLVWELGVWHEDFFIYWDDMEWGARFNARGVGVLATRASVVYHPSWVERTADTSAIWRNYYRVRNALRFFNNYEHGLRRRILLGRMVFRFMKYALNACLSAQPTLSQAFVSGIRDFLRGRYGKRAFSMPPTGLHAAQGTDAGTAPCLFLDFADSSEAALRFMGELTDREPACTPLAVVPAPVGAVWERLLGRRNVVSFQRNRRGRIRWRDRLRILFFLAARSWNLMIVAPRVPRLGAVWGRAVARVDFEQREVVAKETMPFGLLLRLPWDTVFLLARVVTMPPGPGWGDSPGGTPKPPVGGENQAQPKGKPSGEPCELSS